MFWLFKNFPLKLLALVLALLLWVNVVLEEEYSSVIRFPLKCINLPSDLVISSEYPQQAEVRIQATGWALVAVRFMTKMVIVDLSRAKWGAQSVPLTPDNVYISGDLAMSSTEVVSPRSIDFVFDTMIRRAVPISSRVSVEPAPDFIKVGEVVFEPEKVVVNGPRPEVTRIKRIHTRTEFIRDLSADTTFPVVLEPPDVPGVSLEPDTVMARVHIENKVKKTVKGIPVRLINVPRTIRAHLEPPTVSLIIVGGDRIVRKIGQHHFSAIIDYSRTELENSFELAPEISKFIDEVEYYNVEPPKIKIVRKPR